MKSNSELKEIDIENCISQYFDGIINIIDLDLDHILLDKKSYENILIYDVAWKTPYCAKPLVLVSVKQRDIQKT